MMVDHSSPKRRRCRANTTTDDERSLSRNWLELPRDVTVAILQKVPVIDILKNVRRVCTNWRSVCKEEPLLWKRMDDYSIRFLRHPEICRQAVDLSRGCLIDLSMGSFATNDLLHYVTDRCTKIQRLKLKNCDEITDEGLYNVANKFPLLEDLELSYCHNITKKSLQRLGECCPRLKSLKINHQGSRIGKYRNGEAMTIAKHMPELRHLQLFGNGMTKSGLDAILEGCPHLESLDLRQCFNIYLEDSSLRKICDERRIRDLRCPNDSTDDYQYGDTLIEVEYVRRCKEVGYADDFTEYLESYGYVPDESTTYDLDDDDDDESTISDSDDDDEPTTSDGPVYLACRAKSF